MGGMRDCRYKKTEEKILSVFFDVRYSTLEQIAKKAGVPRSTFYMHHHSVMKILPDWEAYILEEYRLIIKRGTYFEMLIFILKNRRFFEVFLKFKDREVVMEMIFSLWNIEKNRKNLRILASEIVEVIFEWGEKGFPENEIERVLSDILYLVKTRELRLGPIDR